MPEAWKELAGVCAKLETHFRDHNVAAVAPFSIFFITRTVRLANGLTT